MTESKPLPPPLNRPLTKAEHRAYLLSIGFAPAVLYHEKNYGKGVGCKCILRINGDYVDVATEEGNIFPPTLGEPIHYTSLRGEGVIAILWDPAGFDCPSPEELRTLIRLETLLELRTRINRRMSRVEVGSLEGAFVYGRETHCAMGEIAPQLAPTDEQLQMYEDAIKGHRDMDASRDDAMSLDTLNFMMGTEPARGETPPEE